MNLPDEFEAAYKPGLTDDDVATKVYVDTSLFTDDGAFLEIKDESGVARVWLDRAEVKRLRRALKATIAKEAGE